MAELLPHKHNHNIAKQDVLVCLEQLQTASCTTQWEECDAIGIFTLSNEHFLILFFSLGINSLSQANLSILSSNERGHWKIVKSKFSWTKEASLTKVLRIGSWKVKHKGGLHIWVKMLMKQLASELRIANDNATNFHMMNRELGLVDVQPHRSPYIGIKWKKTRD